MSKIKGVSVFVPVYNEEKIVERNVKRLESELKKITDNYELMIVDDSSKDKTGEISRRIAKEKIKYMRFENGPSRRENLAEAMKQAKKETIVFIDVDLSADLKHLRELLENLEGYDMNIGSRYSGISARRTFFRKSISVIYNTILRVLFNSKIKDHQCGFKAYKKEVILDLIKDAGYDKSFIRGWVWDAEILIRAQKKGYRIREFPVKWDRGKDSSFQFKREIKMLLYCFILKMKL